MYNNKNKSISLPLLKVEKYTYLARQEHILMSAQSESTLIFSCKLLVLQFLLLKFVSILNFKTNFTYVYILKIACFFGSGKLELFFFFKFFLEF